MTYPHSPQSMGFSFGPVWISPKSRGYVASVVSDRKRLIDPTKIFSLKKEDWETLIAELAKRLKILNLQAFEPYPKDHSFHSSWSIRMKESSPTSKNQLETIYHPGWLLAKNGPLMSWLVWSMIAFKVHGIQKTSGIARHPSCLP